MANENNLPPEYKIVDPEKEKEALIPPEKIRKIEEEVKREIEGQSESNEVRTPQTQPESGPTQPARQQNENEESYIDENKVENYIFSSRISNRLRKKLRRYEKEAEKYKRKAKWLHKIGTRMITVGSALTGFYVIGSLATEVNFYPNEYVKKHWETDPNVGYTGHVWMNPLFTIGLGVGIIGLGTIISVFGRQSTERYFEAKEKVEHLEEILNKIEKFELTDPDIITFYENIDIEDFKDVYSPIQIREIAVTRSLLKKGYDKEVTSETIKQMKKSGLLRKVPYEEATKMAEQIINSALHDWKSNSRGETNE